MTDLTIVLTQTENNHMIRDSSISWIRGKHMVLLFFLNVNGSFKSLNQGFEGR